jgi:hypothetical protein
MDRVRMLASSLGASRHQVSPAYIERCGRQGGKQVVSWFEAGGAAFQPAKPPEDGGKPVVLRASVPSSSVHPARTALRKHEESKPVKVGFLALPSQFTY